MENVLTPGDGPPLLPAVVYAAKSTEDVRGSIPTQLDDCRAAAEREGRTIVGEYHDEGMSGYRSSRGPGLEQAKRRAADAAHEHGAAELWVQHSDRIARGDGRTADHLAEVFFAMRKARVRLRSVQDDENLEDVIRVALIGERNHEDSKRKGAAVAAGRRRAAERGDWTGGPVPDGYKVDRTVDDRGRVTNRLVLGDPARVEVVRMMFEWASAGVSHTEITHRLNERGVRSPRGGDWHRQNVKRTLQSAVYFGAVEYRGEVVCEDAHEAIVSHEVWQRAQQTMTTHKRVTRGRYPKGAHLLRGMLVCGVCGETMRTRTNRSGRGSYFCDREAKHRDRCPGHGPYQREAIDAAVLGYFNRVGLDMDATRAAFAEHAERRLREARLVRESAEREHGEAVAALKRMRDDYRRGLMDRAEWDEHRADLVPEVEAAEAAAERARAAERDATETAELPDVEADVLRHLADLRRAIVSEVRDVEQADAARAALVRLFDGFVLEDEDAIARAGALTQRIDPAHGWQPDLFVDGPDGATVYVRPLVKPVVVEGFAPPDEHAPAQAFPVLKRAALEPPNLGVPKWDRTG